MKKSLVLLIIVLLSLNTLKADNWLNSFEDAKKIALATNKLVLVNVWYPKVDCKKMDKESWVDNDVQALMSHFVSVKVNVLEMKKKGYDYKQLIHNLDREIKLEGSPIILIIDGNGNKLFKQVGYLSKEEIVNLLKRYAKVTKFIGEELIDFYNADSFLNTFTMAVKYQEFSMKNNIDFKDDFLKNSNTYFKTAKRLLRFLKQPEKQFFKQRIELHDIQKNLILNKSKKALRQLERISKKGIDDKNISFYNLLQYIANKGEGNIEEVNLISKGLSKNDLQKAELFFRS